MDQLVQNFDLNETTIKQLSAFEDLIYENKPTPLIINEIMQIYSVKLLEINWILWLRKDPIRNYFQEKVSSLFLKKNVMEAFLSNNENSANKISQENSKKK